MHEIRQDGAAFVGYEYLELPADGETTARYLDGYQNFGWALDGRTSSPDRRGRGKLVLRRNRNMANRVELTRLQRHFEACMAELAALEQSKTTRATACAIALGLVGTALLAGATFAVTAAPPNLPLTVLLAVPGFAGWVFPWFLFRRMVAKRSQVVEALKEKKIDEIEAICRKGHALLQ